MADKKWRKNLDNVIEQNLNELIKETKEFDYAIFKSKNKSKAQIWIALALINNKLNNILNEKKYKKKLTNNELNSIIKTLENL